MLPPFIPNMRHQVRFFVLSYVKQSVGNMRQKFTFLKKRKKKIYKKIAFRAFNTHATEKFLKTKIIEIVLKTNEQIENNPCL